MRIKIHTLIKGAVWEALGVLVLFAYIWFTTNDIYQASACGIGYPVCRAIMWYPYERMFKRIWRSRNTVERMPITIKCRREYPAGNIHNQESADTVPSRKPKSFSVSQQLTEVEDKRRKHIPFKDRHRLRTERLPRPRPPWEN